MRLWALSLFCLGATGCAHGGIFRTENRAQLAVVDASLEFTSADRAEWSATVEISNLERSPLVLSNIEWELGLDGRFFATGIYPLSEQVAPLQKKVMEVKIPIVFRNLTTKEDERWVQVLWKGRISLGLREDSLSVPFSFRRSQRMKKAPLFR